MASSVNIKKGQGYVLGTGATATGISSVSGSSNNGVMSASTSGASGSAANGPATSYQEFSVRVPKLDRPMSVMRFNGALNVDMGKWTSLKMVRDDHTNRAKTEFKFDEPDMPKFGAGSEYGREARDELRRRKYGGNRKKVAPEDQPWILKSTSAVDKITRRYKGLREGTISSNASYFVFTQATDGQFEVFPVSQWYNFTPVQTYKALSAEEAEEEFGRRDKIMNFFNVMFRKRMRGDEADGGEKDEEKTSKKKGGGGGGLKVSEMEDWDDVNEMESDDDDDDEDAPNKDDKKKKKKGAGGKKKKKKGSDSEANEDSDDGDGEGRELDYISDTSDSSGDEETKEGDKLELPGVEQEPGLSNLLESDSSDEEDKDKKDKEGEEKAEDEEKPNKSNKSGNGNKKTGNKKSNKKKTNDSQAAAVTENLSDGDSDDSEGDAMNEFDDGSKPGSSSQSSQGRDSSKPAAAGSSSNIDKERESTPEGEDGVDGRKKRKAGQPLVSGNAPSSAKKAKMEVNPILLQTAASEGITEEAVRRYLHRKPMTVTELLQKFKSKKTKVSSEDMVTIIASILKKINPTKRNQNGKMYLSLKA